MKSLYNHEPIIEIMCEKGKMSYRGEINLVKGEYKLIFISNSNVVGKLGLESTTKGETQSKKQILDFYCSNNIINLKVEHDTKLVIRFVVGISLDKDQIIDGIYCMTNEEYLHCGLKSGTRLYIVII